MEEVYILELEQPGDFQPSKLLDIKKVFYTDKTQAEKIVEMLNKPLIAKYPEGSAERSWSPRWKVVPYVNGGTYVQCGKCERLVPRENTEEPPYTPENLKGSGYVWCKACIQEVYPSK